MFLPWWFISDWEIASFLKRQVFNLNYGGGFCNGFDYGPLRKQEASFSMTEINNLHRGMGWLHFLLCLLILPSLFVTDGSYFPWLLFLSSGVFPKEVCLHTPQAGIKHGNELWQSFFIAAFSTEALSSQSLVHAAVHGGEMEGATHSWLWVTAGGGKTELCCFDGLE